MPCPVPDPHLPIELQSTVILRACAVWGESRGCSDDAKRGVVSVIFNRAKQGKYGQGVVGVILKKYQFSSFLKSDPNYTKLLQPLEYDSVIAWEACYRIAEEAMQRDPVDVTAGAVFYFSHPLTEPPAAWGAVECTGTIDGLHFYREFITSAA